jgi:hypothetical protein
MNAYRRNFGVLSGLALLTTGACFGPPPSSTADVGNIEANLQLSPSTSLNTASYSITGPNMFARSGTVDVSRSQTISFTVGGVPAGSGYNATITGTATDGVTTCSGSGMFSISAGMTSLVMISVRCHEPPKAGSVQINGTVNVCPVVDGVGVTPGEVMVGSSSALSASAHDSNAGPAALTYSWTATSGALSGADTATPTLLCTAAGLSTVTLTVSDGDCTDTATVTVTCSPAPVAPALVKINEVESNGGTPGDWVELINIGGTTADLSGWRFRDNDPARVTAPAIIPAGTLLPPGQYYVLNEVVSGVGQFNFGLGAADSAIVTDANDAPVDSYSWTAHAAVTYGRCPNGTGAFVNTATSTKGAANDCPVGGTGGTGGGAAGGAAGTTGGAGTTGAAGASGMAGTTGAAGTTGSGGGGAGGGAGMATLQAWPGDDAVVVVDGVNQFTSNLSGLSYQAGSGTDPDVVWGIQNSPSLLHRLVFDPTTSTYVGTPTDGWAAGKTIHYPNGTGSPDSEGITRAEDGTPAMYVATERDNDNSGVSRMSILRYDTSAPGTELTATHEWNVTADLPAAGSNLGLEAITWIPDTYLVASGFIDETTLSAYDPSRYPAHGGGLFFVGVEATGSIYGYALDHVGGGFTRVASLSSGQPSIMDLAFDREVGQLWAYCDNTCANKATLLGVTGGHLQVRRFFDHPTGLPDSNNEGITFAPESQCMSGRKAFFWADDANVNMHALRRGAVTCGSLL